MQDSSEFSSKQFDARTGINHPLGKCTEPAETTLPVVVDEGFTVYRNMIKQGRSQILRDELVVLLFGRMAMLPGAQVCEDGVIHRSISVDDALTGLAFSENVSKAEYVNRVLAAHVFGRLHVLKHGAIGTDQLAEQLPVYPASTARRSA